MKFLKVWLCPTIIISSASSAHKVYNRYLTLAGFKIRHFFFGAERSGGAVLAKISGAERSGGAVLSKKFGAERSGGAEISKNFDFFGVFHEFFANYCSRGT
jgi:hypothetical protein